MHKAEEIRGRGGAAAKSCAFGVVVTAVVLIALMLMVSVLISGELLPESLIDEMLIMCVLISCAAGSLVSAKRCGRKALATGVLSSSVVLFLIILITALRGHRAEFTVMTLKISISCIAGGAIGGVVSTMKSGKRRSRRIHR